jgi:hypothetical protein
MGMQEAFARLYARRVPLDERGLFFNVTFVNRAGPMRLLGPLGKLWVEDRALRSERVGAPLAESFYRLETDSRVVVHFAGQEQSPSRSFGTYSHFCVIDRLAYADGKALALYSPKIQQWLCYDAGRHWPAMVISPSGPGSQS